MELTNFNSEKKYSSKYLVEQINIFRKEEGNNTEALHKNILMKIENEFADEIGELKIKPTSYTDASNRQSKMYELTFEQSLQLLMSESKSVRKKCVEVMKNQQQLIKPLSISKILLQSAQALVELEERQDRIESKVDFLLEAREQSLEKLNYIERSTQEVPEISLKDKIRELVNSYAKSNNIPYSTVWKLMYEKLYYIFHFSVNAHKKLHDKESLLDICERKNQLDNLFAICSKELI